MQDECRGSGAPPESNDHHVEFDRFDDEQFMSMFTTDEISAAAAAAAAAGPTGSCSNPSTPSDHNSINDDDQPPPHGDQKKKRELKHEFEEAESECKLEAQPTQNGDNNATKNTSSDRKVDPKRVKR